MDRRWVALDFAVSRILETVRFSGVLLAGSLLFAACSPNPGSAPPATDAGAPVATTAGTPLASEAASPPEPGSLVQDATTESASPAAAMEQDRAASPQTLPPDSVPPATAAPAEIALAHSAVPASTVAPKLETTRPAPETSPVPVVADIGGPVQVEATKAGLTRVGAAKCKLCHKVQFTSWAKTAHATRVPPMDCESCHGAGSEYKSLAIMKDPKKARAAGLVIPVRSFCTQCHKSGWTDDQLKRAHAHKAGA